MTISKVVEKMTSIVGKADLDLEEAVTKFRSDLSDCRDDLISSTDSLSVPYVSRSMVSFTTEYINLFLNKFGKVDALIDKLIGTGSTLLNCHVTEDEFRGIDLKDVGIENVPQPPSKLTLWNYRTPGSLQPGIANKTRLMAGLTAEGGATGCFGDKYSDTLLTPYGKCAIKAYSENNGVNYLSIMPAFRSTDCIALYAIRKSTDNIDVERPGHDSPALSYVGEFKTVESPHTTLLTTVDDTVTGSPSKGFSCKTYAATPVGTITVNHPKPLLTTLGAGEGNNESPSLPPVPPMVNAGEPEDWTLYKVTDIVIEFANKGQTILDFTKLLDGNFGSIATDKGIDGLLVPYKNTHSDIVKKSLETQAAMLVKEAQELSDSSVTWSNIKNSRQMEMLASLFAVKFALIKMLCGHVRRVK